MEEEATAAAVCCTARPWLSSGGTDNSERKIMERAGREAGLGLGFSPFGGATWRACDERVRHAAAKGYGRSAMMSTRAHQQFNF
jgi:hypothetical protein